MGFQSGCLHYLSHHQAPDIDIRRHFLQTLPDPAGVELHTTRILKHLKASTNHHSAVSPEGHRLACLRTNFLSFSSVAGISNFLSFLDLIHPVKFDLCFSLTPSQFIISISEHNNTSFVCCHTYSFRSFVRAFGTIASLAVIVFFSC